jgi:hypothetical protein
MCQGSCVPGFDRVRKLYDDLQYLSFREHGITSDEYVVQGWVIVMKVLEAACIPRGSFWDIANSQIGGTDMKTISDARMMEKLWYTMFSLLPLCEFDEFGVIIEGRRQGAFFRQLAVTATDAEEGLCIVSCKPKAISWL